MKYLLIIALSTILYACCGTKQVVKNSPDSTSKQIVKTDTPETPEVSEIPEIPETKTIEIVDVQVDYVDGKNPNANEENLIKNPNYKEPISGTAETPVETDSTTQEESNITDNAFDHSSWNDLLKKHVSDQGNVNYKGFIADKKAFNSYLKLLSDNPPQDAWSKNKTLAYWMNVYNAYTVKLILDNYPTQSIKDIDGPWSHRFIKIGEKWYTLNDVEHRIIRKMDEPRIHFALVCAAVSCPKLYNKAFTSENLEDDLAMLTRSFLSDQTKNEISKNRIKISKIFKWYGGDFKNNGRSLIDFLNEYTEVSISSNAKKSYTDYNWALNE